jgi:hypothetical protein
MSKSPNGRPFITHHHREAEVYILTASEIDAQIALIQSRTDERDHARDIAVSLEQELAEMRRRVEELHATSRADLGCQPSCLECGFLWPCPTVLAVQDGDQ